VLLFAVSCGISVANAYYAQPILHTIANSFGTTSGTAGLIVTLTQIGFATGLALLVPAGDLVSRRRLAPIVLAVAAVGLLVSAEAPSIGIMIAVAWFVGLGSVVAQFLVPMAASLADDAHRGEVVGTVMTGLLVGILLARTLSGLVAGIASWRAVYIMAAVLTLMIAVVLRRVLPEEEAERPTSSYRSLLASTAKLLVDEPTLRLRSWFGALGFAAFGAF
jgi:predicted MFS family arabinose efflux permease